MDFFDFLSRFLINTYILNRIESNSKVTEKKKREKRVR